MYVQYCLDTIYFFTYTFISMDSGNSKNEYKIMDIIRQAISTNTQNTT